MEIKFIKDLNDRQKLWKTSGDASYVVSSFRLPVFGEETMVFESNSKGEIINFLELAVVNVNSHELVIDEFVASRSAL